MENKYTVISALDLRYHFPEIRKNLGDKEVFIVLYRGEPVGELHPPSRATQEQFLHFSNSGTFPKTPAGKRIVENIAKRKQKRLRRSK